MKWDHKWLKQYLKKNNLPDIKDVLSSVPKQGKSKYNNRKCRCLSNHVHLSRDEGDYCNVLRLLVKAGEIKSYEVEKNFPLKVENMTIANHRPDFLVTLNDGSIEVREFKSPTTMTRAWRLKQKLFIKNYPEIPYKIVTEKDLMR